MIMLFEDNEKSSISQLIKLAYSSDKENAGCVCFAGGNRNITAKLEKLAYNGEKVVVYIDTMPDHPQAVSAYNYCVEWVIENKLNNVHIIPIPCIEYYVVSAFFREQWDEVKVVKYFGDYVMTSVNHSGKELDVSSFEKYCKSVVNNYRSCLKNNGAFYTADCKCDVGKYLEHCVDIELLRKAWLLVSELPVFAGSSTNIYRKTEKVNVEQVRKEAIQKYYEIAERYMQLGIIEDIQRLVEY